MTHKVNRSKAEIFLAVLEVAEKGRMIGDEKRGVPRYQLVYGANLSFKQAHRYVDSLIEKGYLDVTNLSGNFKEYQLSKKGLEFKEKLSSVKEHLKELDMVL